jgi:CHAD domain-containing protein
VAGVDTEYLVNTQRLLGSLPGIRDGEASAVHDARVAIRRLRAALPVLEEARAVDRPTQLSAALKSASKALGASRDVDVAIDLLNDIERRSPSTAAAAATLRAHLVPEQARRRRKLIKRLESLGVEKLLRDVVLAKTDAARARDRRTVRALAEAMPARVEAVTAAVEHATGVYFPNRAHGVRVAVKKLRYLVEFQDDRDAARRPVLRALKRAQDVLGRLHDREMLARRLGRLARDRDIPSSDVLSSMLEAEVRGLFEEYRDARTELIGACTALTEHARDAHWKLPKRMLKVGAVAVPSAAVLLFASRRRLVG